jgi:acyl-CoA synthetase (AMP-forming)/AMP-acid ligase II
MLLDWLSRPDAERGLNLLDTDGSWRHRSYTDLALDVLDMKFRLQSNGTQPGDVISLVIADPEMFVRAFMATLAAGAVPAPHAPPTAFRDADRYTGQLAALLAVARPRDVIAEQAFHPLVSAAVRSANLSARLLDPAAPRGAAGTSAADPVPAHSQHDTALLQFTSGTSGSPKAVRVSWSNLTANVGAIREWLRWSDQDVFASWLPLHHDMGLVGAMITPLALGTDLWLMTPRQFVREPVRWLECFGTRGATLTTAPGFGYAHVARRVTAGDVAGMDFAGWRVAIVGAERADAAALAGFHRLTAPRGFRATALTGAYGLAEATLVATGTAVGSGTRLVRVRDPALAVGEPVVPAGHGLLGQDAVTGAGWLAESGTPVTGTRLAVVDEEGQELPPGRFGEIVLTGDSIASGYLTAGGVRPFGPRGLRTGDAGFVLDGGTFVVGRIAESMKVRGAHLHAEDVEAELAALRPGTAPPCAVAFGGAPPDGLAVVFVEGEPDPRWVEAAADRVAGATAGAARVAVLSGGRGAIVRTSSGKPRRRLLWQRLLAGEDPAWQVRYGSLPGGVSAGSGRPDTGGRSGHDDT